MTSTYSPYASSVRAHRLVEDFRDNMIEEGHYPTDTFLRALGEMFDKEIASPKGSTSPLLTAMTVASATCLSDS